MDVWLGIILALTIAAFNISNDSSMANNWYVAPSDGNVTLCQQYPMTVLNLQPVHS